MNDKFKYLAKLKDGRVGQCYRYKYKRETYYNVQGVGFGIDDLKAEDIEDIILMKNIFENKDLI